MHAESDLLLTKITTPSWPRKNVSRERLLSLLEEGPQPKLTTVVAPAGYGKSTLLQEWIGSELEKGVSVAWLSLDAYDNNPARFWSYLAAALKRAAPSLDIDLNSIMQGVYAGDPLPGIDLLLSASSRQSTPILLVLDDYHEISNPSIHDAFAYFIRRGPENLRICISSRTAPPIPLSRLRAQQQLLELSSHDLAFGSSEAKSLLSDVMQLEVDEGETTALLKATEGWAVGLQLAALSLKEGRHCRKLPAARFGSSHQFVEYFTEEVLDQLAPDRRDFLLKTSVLEGLSAGLCNAILGRDDSQNVLEGLEAERLFIEPVEESRNWYRYHALFAGALQAILERENPGELARIRKDACIWLWENGYNESAVTHALALEDFDRAAQIIEGCAMDAVTSLRLMELSNWIDQLPDELITRRPSLGISYAIACFDLGWLDAIEPKLQLIETSLQLGANDEEERSANERESNNGSFDDGKERNIHAEIAAIRAAVACVEGDYATGITLAQNVIEDFPNANAIVMGVHQDLAYAYESAWELEAAKEAFEQVCQSSLRLGCHRQFVRSRCEIARIQKKQGQLVKALRSYESALQYAEQHKLDEEWVICPQTGLAEICVEQNDLDVARNWIDQATDFLMRADAGAVTWLHIIPVYSRIASCQLALGNVEGALALSERFRSVLSRLNRLSIQPLGEALDVQVRVWLAAGELSSAKRVIPSAAQHAYGPGTLKTSGRLAIARIKIAEEDFEEALETLVKVEKGARSVKAVQPLIEALSLKAAALWFLDRRDESMGIAAEALDLGNRHEFLRIFSAQGDVVRPVLEELLASKRQKGSRRRYLQEVLSCFDSPKNLQSNQAPSKKQGTGQNAGGIASGTSSASNAGDSQPQASQGSARERYEEACAELARLYGLTPRQHEVFLMLAKGRNARYIQDQLCVSNHTSKSHIYSIYRKLGVHSQQELISQIERCLSEDSDE